LAAAGRCLPTRVMGGFMTRLRLATTLLSFLAGPSHAMAAPQPCAGLTNLRLADTVITMAVPTLGTFTSPDGKLLEDLPAFCRVVGVIRPTSDSHIEFEVWMPIAGWNGKFQGIGNGGFAGAIPHEPLAQAVRRGYAAASTDTGHKGGGTDAKWALGHPEKVIDFGHRAIHEMTVKAKAVVAAFYGEPPSRSYFASCSTGGRQALMEAQRYPDDYDGLVAGAPAAAWTRLLFDKVWNAQALLRPAAHITPATLAVLTQAVVAACDRRDGVPDGVLVSPDTCSFDPHTLLCKGVESDDCLSAQQAAALAAIYDGPRTSDGRRLARGFPPGAETGPGGWARWLTGPAPGQSLQATFAQGALAYMVFERPNYDLGDFAFERDVAIVDAKLGPLLNATDLDLSAFHKRGGKLILFHGWNDPALSVYETIDYYQAVRGRMGSAVDAFARLYLIPGLQHCTGGPGATYIGGLNVPFRDAEHDVSAAVERWVEEGVAPGDMIATAAPDRTNLAAAAPATPRRRICPYPQVPVFDGKGSPDDPAAWACQAP
jgi:hypothetical protein